MPSHKSLGSIYTIFFKVWIISIIHVGARLHIVYRLALFPVAHRHVGQFDEIVTYHELDGGQLARLHCDGTLCRGIKSVPLSIVVLTCHQLYIVYRLRNDDTIPGSGGGGGTGGDPL